MTTSVGDYSMKATQPETTLGDLLEIMSRRRSTLGTIFLITVFLAMTVSFTRPPVYEASNTLIAEKTPPVVLLGAAGPESNIVQQPLAQASDVFTLAELVKSDVVFDAATARLSPPLNPRIVTNILHRSLRVQQVRNTDLVRVDVKYRDPGIAAAVANAVADSVVDMDLRARRRQATIARDFIGGQLERASGELRTSEHSLAAFKKESQDVSLSDETQLNLRKLADLERDADQVHLQLQQAQVGLARTLSASQQGGALEYPDPVVSALQSQLATLQVEYSGLRKQFTPIHPQVISTEAKIEETQRRLGAEIDRKTAALRSREHDLSLKIEKVQRTLIQVPTREAVLARLTLDTKDAERTYLLLSEKFQEARIAEGSIGSAVRVVDAAKIPAAPSNQRRTYFAVGAIMGLLLGAAGVFMTEQLDVTVKSVRDAERLLGAPVLGTAPCVTSEETGTNRDSRVPPTIPAKSGITSESLDAFRAMRTRVLEAMRRTRSKCLIVTSALPHEGKTTIAANLALSTAQTDRRVWLVDCNLRQPVIHRIFPEAVSPGLSAFLAGRVQIEDIVRSTRWPRLECVGSDAETLESAELLDSQLMTQLVDQARERADVVLLDCPAVQPLTDAQVVGAKTDGAILVVQIGKTGRAALGLARQHLERSGVHIIGIVVNQGCDVPITRSGSSIA